MEIFPLRNVCIYFTSVPRGLIDNFQVVTTSSTSATFNWTEVLCEYRGGRLLWYEVNVTAVNTTAVLQGLFTNVTYISVNGLAPSTHYMVSVRYVNTAGTGNSSVHYFQTSENGTWYYFVRTSIRLVNDLKTYLTLSIRQVNS